MSEHDSQPPAGGVDVLEHADVDRSHDNGWTVLLDNDPVNMMQYVVAVLVRVLEVSKENAEQLMMEAHRDGSAAVYQGERDAATAIATQLKNSGLWARLERA